MEFIARFLRFLFWVVLVSWTVSLLRRLVNHMGASQAPAGPYVDVLGNAAGQKLVRDPVCGMHVAPGLALSVNQGSEMVHFCSAECRDKYLNQTKRLPANG
jgi:YHS domain-containing protein